MVYYQSFLLMLALGSDEDGTPLLWRNLEAPAGHSEAVDQDDILVLDSQVEIVPLPRQETVKSYLMV